jgi:hypothetical protein
MSNDHAHAKPKEFFFFVDNTKYETDKALLTGGEIKTMISGFDPLYSLFLEGPGDEPDELVSDITSVSLEKDKGPKRFYTVPPTNFGS